MVIWLVNQFQIAVLLLNFFNESVSYPNPSNKIIKKIYQLKLQKMIG